MHWTEPATSADFWNSPRHSETKPGGQERVTDTVRLARLNLSVQGLSGDIKQGNTYYEDLQDSVGRFDFVLANPPLNVSKIDKEHLAGARASFWHPEHCRLSTSP